MKPTLEKNKWANMAHELSAYVHENCKEVPHDIGIHLADIVDTYYDSMAQDLEVAQSGYAALVNLVVTLQLFKDVDVDWEDFPKTSLSLAHKEITNLRKKLEMRNFVLPTEKVESTLEKDFS